MRTLPVVETLQALIETCSDAAYRFHACARHATNPLLRAMLNECLQQRTRWRAELQAMLNPLQAKQDAQESEARKVAADNTLPLHAGWISVRCAFSPERPDDLVIEECRRGEQFVMARYQESLKRPDLITQASSGTRKIEAVVRRQLISMCKDDRRIAAFGASRCMPARRRHWPSQSQAQGPQGHLNAHADSYLDKYQDKYKVKHKDTYKDNYSDSQARLQVVAAMRRKPAPVAVLQHLDS